MQRWYELHWYELVPTTAALVKQLLFTVREVVVCLLDVMWVGRVYNVAVYHTYHTYYNTKLIKENARQNPITKVGRTTYNTNCK